MAKTTEAKETSARTGRGRACARAPRDADRSRVGSDARDISAALAGLLADVFALYMKTKNFPHWHLSGAHFRDYHLLLDEHGDQIFAMTDPIAELAHVVVGASLRSIGDISPAPAPSRQRRRLRRSEGHAGGAARRQQEPDVGDARGPRRLRRVRRRRDRQPARSLDRRDRAADLVPV